LLKVKLNFSEEKTRKRSFWKKLIHFFKTHFTVCQSGRIVKLYCSPFLPLLESPLLTSFQEELELLENLGHRKVDQASLVKV